MFKLLIVALFLFSNITNGSYTAPTVRAKYESNAGQTITTSVVDIVDFEDKIYDSHDAVTTGASWKFTAPTTGYYFVSMSAKLADTNWGGANELLIARVYRNGVWISTLNENFKEVGMSESWSIGGSDVVYISANDYIDIRLYQNHSSDIALNTVSQDNRVTIYLLRD